MIAIAYRWELPPKKAQPTHVMQCFPWLRVPLKALYGAAERALNSTCSPIQRCWTTIFVKGSCARTVATKTTHNSKRDSRHNMDALQNTLSPPKQHHKLKQLPRSSARHSSKLVPYPGETIAQHDSQDSLATSRKAPYGLTLTQIRLRNTYTGGSYMFSVLHSQSLCNRIR